MLRVRRHDMLHVRQHDMKSHLRTLPRVPVLGSRIARAPDVIGDGETGVARAQAMRREQRQPPLPRPDRDMPHRAGHRVLVGKRRDGGDEQPIPSQAAPDVLQKPGQALFRQMFQHLPGGDDVEVPWRALRVEQGEGFGDVGGEQLFRHDPPETPAVDTGKVAAFDTIRIMTCEQEIPDQPAPRAAEIEMRQGPGKAPFAGADEAGMARVVVGGAAGMHMVGAEQRDGMRRAYFQPRRADEMRRTRGDGQRIERQVRDVP